MGNILVLDGQQRNVLSCVRSLAKEGHSVVVGAHKRGAFCFSSRYTSRRWLYPDPSEQPSAFLDALLEEIKTTKYDLVLPFIDASTRIIVDAQTTIRQYAPIHVPSREAFQMAFDKARTCQIAQALNIPMPVTCYPESLHDAVEHAKNLGYPLVIKPRQSSGSRGLKIVNNEQELEHHFPRIHSNYPEPLLQEYIPHQDSVGFVALYDRKGKLKACCQHRRLHEFPLSGGPSTLRETIADDRLNQYGTAILEKLNWTGPAMVEFRVDSRGGVPKLMEINPRLWGSIALHIAAGVNFPELIYRDANNIPYTSVTSYKVGFKAKWLLPGEVLYFLANLRRGKIELDALKWWGQDQVLDIVSLDDPLPALVMMKNIIISLFDIKTIKHTILRN